MWAKVARATANGELGIAAKISPQEEPDRHRLLCIYTRDFNDKDDVARVLHQLQELGLVHEEQKRQICYKTGRYTTLTSQLSQNERSRELIQGNQMPSPTWDQFQKQDGP